MGDLRGNNLFVGFILESLPSSWFGGDTVLETHVALHEMWGKNCIAFGGDAVARRCQGQVSVLQLTVVA